MCVLADSDWEKNLQVFGSSELGPWAGQSIIHSQFIYKDSGLKLYYSHDVF